ncbi:Enoyl LovC [Cyphellophora attinorum]|uniref:Enoyl LovC n=1 Tax=Cyphellophora attinorum TaxID=1664694 RepID=A0A0N1HCC4_9EURO|nr:Enoyl LovC [Phialophora attinorum]KPI42305.1 Enoyl LovC [Phialophora attinorum]
MTANVGIYIGSDNKLEFRDGLDLYKPTSTQALIKVESSGINPADIKHGRFGLNEYIAGYELAGVVLEAGSSSEWKPGDVICGSNATNKHKPWAHGAHQAFAVAENGHMWDRVPPQVPLSHAAGTTIVLRTAADAMFNTFRLPLPQGTAEPQPAVHGAILIWGGATQVGVAAIQLARAAGLSTIYATASPQRHAKLRQLGATEVFDYRDEHVVENIQRALNKSGQDLKYVFDTVVSSGDVSSTAQCVALKSRCEVVYACTIPVFEDTRWNMVVASRGHDFPEPRGPFKAQPEREVVLQRAVASALAEYGKSYIVPNVRVLSKADEVIDAMYASANGQTGFEKIAIQHPLLG